MNEAPRYTATNLGKSLQSQGRQQIWLAGQLGVSKSMMSKVIAGDRSVDRATAEKISSLIGIPIFLLFELRKRSNPLSHTEAA